MSAVRTRMNFKWWEFLWLYWENLLFSLGKSSRWIICRCELVSRLIYIFLIISYRHVRVSTNEEGKFLGKTYNRRKIINFCWACTADCCCCVCMLFQWNIDRFVCLIHWTDCVIRSGWAHLWFLCPLCAAPLLLSPHSSTFNFRLNRFSFSLLELLGGFSLFSSFIQHGGEKNIFL